MKLEHLSQQKLEQGLLKIFEKHLGDLSKYKIFFFGSRVNGKSREGSDVDVGLEGPQRIPIDTIAGILGDIEELPTLYTIQVVDFKSASDRFRSVALEHVQPFSLPYVKTPSSHT